MIFIQTDIQTTEKGHISPTLIIKQNRNQLQTVYSWS